jgi:hypothetical protein
MAHKQSRLVVKVNLHCTALVKILTAYHHWKCIDKRYADSGEVEHTHQTLQSADKVLVGIRRTNELGRHGID